MLKLVLLKNIYLELLPVRKRLAAPLASSLDAECGKELSYYGKTVKNKALWRFV